MKTVTVVGSGASGVHFARTLLSKGYAVRMLDVGRTPDAPPPAPDATMEELRAGIRDPLGYFLGDDFSGLTLPGEPGEYYGFPPSKEYVFAGAEAEVDEARGFRPLLSHARGGLARAWTAGVYPYSDDDLGAFPLTRSELAPRYDEVARRIGVSGTEDDLARFIPLHAHLQPPLELDAGGRRLLAAYRRRRDAVNRLGVYLGRTRVAVLSAPLGEREPCDYLARCLWGCPRRSLYTPDVTLHECRAYDAFEYLPDHRVDRFHVNAERRVSGVVTRPPGGGPESVLPVDTLVLAAGTLASSAIFLRSWRAHTGEPARLSGLMDNRQVLVPFLQLRQVARRYDRRSYQYHQIGVGVAPEEGNPYVHGQITILTTAQAHPILQRFPCDLRTATYLFRNVRAGLGLVNLNFADTRRSGNGVRLRAAPESGSPDVAIEYEPPTGETDRLEGAVRSVRRALLRLGCLVPSGLVHVRPMGASVHYAGTLPMSARPGSFRLSPTCRSHDFENLFVVDGCGFPYLPAKNLTFTLMANAVRVAEEAF